MLITISYFRISFKSHRFQFENIIVSCYEFMSRNRVFFSFSQIVYPQKKYVH